MKALKNFEFPTQKSGGFQSKYPWDKLLDGTPYFMVQGEDYSCRESTLALLARSKAAVKGLGVRTAKHTVGDKQGIVLQAYTPDADELAKIQESEAQRKEHRTEYYARRAAAKKAGTETSETTSA